MPNLPREHIPYAHPVDFAKKDMKSHPSHDEYPKISWEDLTHDMQIVANDVMQPHKAGHTKQDVHPVALCLIVGDRHGQDFQLHEFYRANEQVD